MKFFKKSRFISFMFLTLIAIGCQKEFNPSTLDANLTQDLTFTKLDTIEVSYNSAIIRVQHSGTSSDTWYGFITDKVGTKDAILISEKINELKETGKIKNLDKRTSARIELTGLKSAKKYKYIVFATTEDGQLYGNTKSVTFETDESAFLLTQCEDWSLRREGRNASANKETYSIVFNKTNASRCHVGFIAKWLVEYYENQQDIQAEIAEYGGLRLQVGENVFMFSIMDYLVFEELFEYWGYYDEDQNYFEEETFSDSYTFELPRQQSGEYYAVAIGFVDGEPTFTYSVSEINIEKETASEDYLSWIGKWQAKSSNDILYTLNIEENDPNFSFYVYGWECGDSVHDKNCPEECKEHMLYQDFSLYELGIPFTFDALNSKIGITSLNLGAEQADGYSLYWGMFGYTEHDGNQAAILSPEDKIASASLPATGSTTELVGLESTTYKYAADGSFEQVDFTYNSLGYIMYDDQTFDPKPWNQPMELPITLTKLSDVQETTLSHGRSLPKVNMMEMAAKNILNEIRTHDYSKVSKALNDKMTF